MSLLRIRIQPTPEERLARSGETEAAAGDSYVERLLKLIPAEAIGIYLVGLQVIGTEDGNQAALAEWSLACAIFVIVFRAILSTESPQLGLATGKKLAEWWKQFKKEVQWPAVTIATLSFLVWATALGHPVGPWFDNSFNACVAEGKTGADVLCFGQKTGTLFLLWWTPLAAFLYAGERVGNLGPGGRTATADKGPSPKETAPSPPAARQVLDPDSRAKATGLKRAPYRSIMLLHPILPGQSKASQVGTGWLVSPRHIVTAGHVLKDADKVRGWLAYNGDSDSWAFDFEVRSFITHPKYTVNTESAFDIGVITLREDIPGAQALPIKTANDTSPRDIRCAGYPLDKGGLTMYEAKGATKAEDGGMLYHDIDTDDGQSGSPIWFGMRKRVTALHTGHGLRADLNHGVSFDDEIIDWINQRIS